MLRLRKTKTENNMIWYDGFPEQETKAIKFVVDLKSKDVDIEGDMPEYENLYAPTYIGHGYCHLMECIEDMQFPEKMVVAWW